MVGKDIDVKEVFRQQGRSEEFIECLKHLERLQKAIETLPENEAGLMRTYVRNAYKGDKAASEHDVSLDAEEIDALLGHEDEPDPS